MKIQIAMNQKKKTIMDAKMSLKVIVRWLLPTDRTGHTGGGALRRASKVGGLASRPSSVASGAAPILPSAPRRSVPVSLA